MKDSPIYLSNFKTYLDDFMNFDRELNIAKIDPFMCNGLMVKGKEEIKKIGFGVSASLSLFKLAKDQNCDIIIVHHSFNQPSYNRFDEIFQERINFLLKNNLSLFGLHFLLDAHPEVGNNVEILKAIGAKPVKPYLHRGDPWGWIGEFSETIPFSTIDKTIRPYLSQRSISYPFGPEKVKRVVALSGKGAPMASDYQDLLDKKIDLYITGEIHEWNRELFRETDISCIAGGHYHTEKFGVQALMTKIKERFTNLQVEWLELENEV